MTNCSAFLAVGVLLGVSSALGFSFAPSSLISSRAVSTGTRVERSSLVTLQVADEGVEAVAEPESKEAPKLLDPPGSFAECIKQAQSSALSALEDGYKLMEVEFPPLPQSLLDDPNSSAEDISTANTRLAISFAEPFAAAGKKVGILFPDIPEYQDAVERQGGSDMVSPGVKLYSLRGSNVGEATTMDELVLGFFGKGKTAVKPVEDVDMYVAVIFSCQELPDLEELHKQQPDKPIVFFNMKLDISRGDLGLLGFPSKDLHFRFLSQIKCAYYLRPRTYARSLPSPPFLISYSGALFRGYPGGFQSLLDIGGGEFKKVVVEDYKPPLGIFKEQLFQAMDLGTDGKGNKESDTASFFRQGFKVKTWWEERIDEETSDNWRS
mmetsp:Transcript_20971/g.30413  ORF Transcript_20971/g.30413 Transcript_20971/m.30413 type:complete len:380 (-) Transcript_20971:156-1295(-)|eukprot:CAMPEP_0113937440 /NCGR_PEP_ID=MMETSP1339-20121228/4066_1 /TAXON_ID=94617 /ORGANISM="Fibrocapsa japonica" /LENGTH=379 /DNA_ID=CAMNT_0000940207 /DNA_START=100 /DNA_END=1239 /DNA_ORIENTATION=- /assembly_acc=CAM_ASM_000762